MTDQQIKDMILEIVADIAPDADLSNINPDVRLREQIELDSMDFLDIIMELRKRYKIDVPEEDYMKLSTLNGCVEYLRPHLKDR
ncbi:MAG TPA: acyl carrier protein [Candidatus Wallbacteria bacterium]|nr:MAG: Acyl carrier protein [bacterium ADurb.Bin243]HOD40497.1 acyl carrier protein [Candidatus Wallbacteria bacterium]HOT75305.1 acyl carrier protein [Candidatus Wallbacteria bacterium]HPG57838.1 acyl carrier protein [Candidatus Wallbacteria bacterium]